MNKKMSAPKETDPDVKTFILEWVEIWTRKFNRPYSLIWGKEGKLVKDMLKVHSLQELRELRGEFFRARDPFITQSGYSIGVFRTVMNKLVANREMDPVEQARRERAGEERGNDVPF